MFAFLIKIFKGIRAQWNEFWERQEEEYKNHKPDEIDWFNNPWL